MRPVLIRFTHRNECVLAKDSFRALVTIIIRVLWLKTRNQE
jgi:hypothetical protein